MAGDPLEASPMRIVLAAEGTRGDLQPMIELGARLRAAGHDALVCGPPDFATQALARGVAFHALGPSVREFMVARAERIGRNPVTLLTEGIRHLRQQLTARLADLIEMTRGADLVVGGGTEIAASSAAERNSVAYRYVAYCPALFPSREHAPAFVPWQGLPGWANRVLWPLVMTPIEFAIGRVLAPARRSVGLAPVRNLTGLLFSGRPLLAVDSVFARVPADAPVPLTQFPALHPLSGEALPAKLVSFLDSGPAPVYFGFGSMPDARPAATTRILLDAIAALGCRAVIGAGWAKLGGTALPEGVIEIGAVSHPELLARCAAVVHHGGAGTTSTAARSGAPQLVVPHLADQFYWGRRVAQLGLGAPPIRRSRLDSPGLVAALGAMLDNEVVAERAREVGERLRAEAASIDPVVSLLG
jgi:UDP:flavonoid glycosyltransferase YjiC (YdhE family)